MSPHRVEPLLHLLDLTLATGSLQAERPLSLMLVSFTGGGKTEVLNHYRDYPGVIYSTYMSWSAMLTEYGQQMMSGAIHHILLPDLNVLVRRSRETAGAELSLLNALVEEGIIRFRTRKTVFNSSTPRTIGMVICTSESELEKLREVAPSGFLSRFLKVSYRYSVESVFHIRHSIRQLEYRQNGATMPQKFQRLPNALVEGDPEVFQRLLDSGILDRIRDEGDTYSLRTQKQIQTLLMASALLNGRRQVNLDDLVELLPLLGYMNPDFKEL